MLWENMPFESEWWTTLDGLVRPERVDGCSCAKDSRVEVLRYPTQQDPTARDMSLANSG